MSDANFSHNELIDWLKSSELKIKSSNIKFLGVVANSEHLPSGYADIDSADNCGRISGNVDGFFDFEISGGPESKLMFYRHAEIASLDSLELQEALDEFFKHL